MTQSTVLHYTIIEKIGEGGMGVVYRATDTKLNRDVALKFLPESTDVPVEAQDRFLQEARAVAQLNHPSICQIYSIEQTPDGRHFIVIEYVDGVTLRDKLRENREAASRSGPKKRDVDWIRKCAVQIASGLKAAHNKGIIHRDIKAGNIMINKAGEIKVLDFGLAKVAGSKDLTKAGSTAGTTAYMAPEQVRGEAVDARSDIWSFGVLLYELVSETMPFGGEYESSVIYSIINEEPKPLVNLVDDCPDDLSDIVQRCLAKDPADRYQSADELLADLSGATVPEKQTATGSLHDAKPVRSRPYSKTRWAAIGTALVVLSALLIFFQVGSGLWSDSSGKPIHVVVLPFANIGEDTGRQFLSDGLVETITSNLTLLEQYQKELWVVPASEVRSYKVLSARDARRVFGVNYAISGSLQPIGDRLRLTISLIDTENLRQINSAVIDVGISEILELHNTSVERLLGMLNLEIQPESRIAIRAGNTSDQAAFEQYVQGLGYLQRFERIENVENAIRSFEMAVERDPGFAIAHAGLAQAYWYRFRISNDRQWIDKALQQSRIAFELDPRLVQVNITLGIINTGTGNYDEAVRNFTAALETDPGNADAYRGLAQAYERKGDAAQAEVTFQRAISLKPDYWAGYNVLGAFYLRNARYTEAETQFRKVIAITPDNYRGYMNLGSMYYFTNRLDEARDMYEEPRFEAFLAGCTADTPEKLVKNCIADVLKFANGADQSDDITVMALARTS